MGKSREKMEFEIPTAIRVCLHCDRKFERIGRQTYCTSKCRTAAWARKERAEQPERQRARGRKHYHANREKCIATNREYKRLNRDSCRDAHREWCRRNKDKCREWNRVGYYKNREEQIRAAQDWVRRNPERRAAYRLEHYQKNKARYIYNANKRKKRVKRATPTWLGRKDYESMAQLYERAARLMTETGVPHDVDHIIPLQGKGVCGLHVPWNLQLLTASENRTKSNSYGS